MSLIIGMCLMVLFKATHVNSFVGIVWGRQQTQQLAPSMVVDLLLQNRIPALRLLTSGFDISEVFANTNISLTITMVNDYVDQANSTGLAYTWVNDRIKEPTSKGVKIVEVSVGTEPFSNSFMKGKRNYQVVQVMKLIRDALDSMDLGYVKTTTAHGMDVTNLAKVPSEADFRDDIKGLMLECLGEFNKSGSPFVLFMFPIHYVREVLQCPMEFAFFDNKSGFKVQDGNVTYTNVVELMIDSVAWAITKAGYPDMKIVIGEIGWPTDGYPHANIQNAERFYKGLMNFFASNKGTPLTPGPIDAFLHSLSDENRFGINWGAFQRHWGIYKADGTPKYKIDFSLQNRDIYPTMAKGIVKMPNRWCIFNGDRSDLALLDKNVKLACSKGDCTRLADGASCDGLDEDGEVSYAFNAYFQTYKQDLGACYFDNLGKIVTDNPSIDTCEFPVEILAFQDRRVQYGMILKV